MPSGNTLCNTIVTLARDTWEIEVHSRDTHPYTDARPMLMPDMYPETINSLCYRDIRLPGLVFYHALRMMRIHHGYYSAGDEVKAGDWLNSPYSLYQRQGHDLARMLSVTEILNHLWLTFPSKDGKKWNQALVVPAYDLPTALQHVTISTGSPFAVGASMLSVAKALQAYEFENLRKHKASQPPNGS